MKTYTRFTVLALIFSVFATINISASGYLNISSMENSMNVRLELAAPTSETIDFYVVDNRNRQLHSKSISGTSDYNELLDLSGLKNGRYTLVTEVANQKFNKVIKVKDNTITELDSYYSFEPVFKLQDETLQILHIDDRSNFILVSIENENGEMYSEEFYMDVIFSESFSLENLVNGNYTVSLSTAREEFSHGLEISR
jgi:hypothetical protein